MTSPQPPASAACSDTSTAQGATKEPGRGGGGTRRAPLESHGVALPGHQWRLLEALARRHERPVSWAVSAVVRLQLEGRRSLPEGEGWGELQDEGKSAKEGKNK